MSENCAGVAGVAGGADGSVSGFSEGLCGTGRKGGPTNYRHRAVPGITFIILLLPH